MKTDGRFGHTVIDIPAKYGQPIELIFLGDEHFNSPNFASTKWQQDMEEIKNTFKRGRTFFVKTGDTFEALSTSERHSLVAGSYHDTTKTRWEKQYLKEVGDYVKQVPFLVGNTLAVFGGNHFFQFYDGTTSDMLLANLLKARYIGVCGYIILTLVIDKHHTHVVKILVHHGKPSGKRAGSAFTALEDAASYFHDADIIVMGHDHKAGAMQLPALSCERGKGDHWKIKECDRIIGRSGTYLKSYEPGTSSYAVDAMYRPSALGYLKVILTPRRTNFGGKDNRTDDRWVQLKAVI